jgi:hypothetical protein
MFCVTCPMEGASLLLLIERLFDRRKSSKLGREAIDGICLVYGSELALTLSNGSPVFRESR